MYRWGYALVALAACFRPSPPAGAPCSSTGSACPTPLSCVAGVCVAGGGGDAAVDGLELGCTCSGDELSCPTGTTSCPLGCVAAASTARCAELVPSNGVDPSPAQTADDITMPGAVTVFGDTGQITGTVTRAAGSGVIAGIDWRTVQTAAGSIGVFSFHSLVADGPVRLRGAIPIAFVVATDATITGSIDGDAGPCGTSTSGDPACGGPGGGNGGTFAIPATGCGGGIGQHVGSDDADTGGGGGGGGTPGGSGGSAITGALGGSGGPACIAADLVPLGGGGGGGGGSPGSAAVSNAGGGGGGAFQLSAGRTITVDGPIEMNGGGGGSGVTDPEDDSGGGCGGGAGGGILLEAATIVIDGSLTANGGGGGGAGDGSLVGTLGASGSASARPAPGGSGADAEAGSGGSGGALGVAAQRGGKSTDPAGGNGGGGGGAAGAIFLRVRNAALTIDGVVSPAPGSGAVQTQ